MTNRLMSVQGFALIFLALSIETIFGQSPNSADLIVTGGKVLLCNQSMQTAEALAIAGNKIIAIGTTSEIEKLANARTERIDATGRVITPGLIDSHLHLLGLGEALQMLDLSSASSWEEIVQLVAERARDKPAGTWIEGFGFHQDKWTSKPEGAVEGYPIHDRLSQAVPDHPVLLTHASGHAVMVNAHAMRLASVTSQTTNPEGGEILKKASGEPTGLFRENAEELISIALRRTSARLSDAERLELTQQRLHVAAHECLKHGVTMVHDAGTSIRDIALLRKLADQQQMPMRASLMVRDQTQAVLDWLESNEPWQSVDNFLMVRSVKLSIDGALGSHGAWLLQPYADLSNSSGLNTLGIEEMNAVAKQCLDVDFQLCVHAIGDRANREVLDAYERVFQGNRADLRWRIEHAQHLSVEDIPRFSKLGVIPAMQTNHCTSDATFVPTRLGERRSGEGAYAWRSLIDAGCIIANGTDAPVERVDPRVSIYAAVTRRLANGHDFYPQQCMTRAEALLSYTYWSAVASFSEQFAGSLESGKLADFVIWDTDLLECPPEKIKHAQVIRTYVDGKLVYQRQ